MLFNSFSFLLFLTTVWVIYRTLPPRGQIFFLICCSYVFYSYWDYRFCALLFVSTLVDFTLGLLMEKEGCDGRRRLFLLASIGTNLGLLGIFKYFNFFAGSLEYMLSNMGVRADFVTIRVVLPVGISFYTFQTMSYVIDVYRRELRPTRNFSTFMLYVSYFPQLVAGPIERAKSLIPQLEGRRTITSHHLRSGFCLIIMGLFKKVVISDTVAPVVDQAFLNPWLFTSQELMEALFYFTFQVYFDFSGYSDIARGVSRLFGIELIENFQYPLLSTSITEFWRRWHISLTTWLRDYVFFPLGGTRSGRSRTYINILITMILCGLWHGAGWNFVIWGGLFGIWLCIERAIAGHRRIPERGPVRNIREFLVFFGLVMYTQLFFALVCMIFRAQSLKSAAAFLQGLFAFSGPLIGRDMLQLLFMTGVVLLLELPIYIWKDHTFLLRCPRPVRWAVYSTMIPFIFMSMLNVREQPFFYFQF